MQSYIAFISYRHLPLDSAVAKRLHRMIEHYLVPRDYRKNGSKRLGRVFRDEDELQLSKDLGESIRNALDHSEYLIAVCTPEYPDSKWCMEELDSFIAGHGRDRVLAVLASGTPSESFPPQLLSWLDENGIAHTAEPLAANVTAPNRAGCMKRLKKERLRLIAAMLGCPYDSLYQREKRYKQRKILAAAAAALVVAGIFIGTLVNKNAQIQARYEEAQTNLRQAQLNESIALTENARLDLSLGRRSDALQSLLKALPAAPGQPYDRSAEGELANALDIRAEDGFRFISNIRQSSDIGSWLLSGDGKLVFTWDSFGMLRAYSAASGKLLWEESLPGTALKDDAMAWCGDPRGVLCPDRSGRLFLISAEDGSECWHLPAVAPVRSVLVRPGTAEAVSLSLNIQENTLFLQSVDLESGTILREEQLPVSLAVQSEPDSFCVSPDGRYAAAVCSSSGETQDRSVLLVDLDTFRSLEFPLMPGCLPEDKSACCFAPDSRLILSCSREEGAETVLTLRTVDPVSGEILTDAQAEAVTSRQMSTTFCLACKSDQAVIIYNRNVFVFRLSDGQLYRQSSVSGQILAITGSVWHRDGGTFACAFDNGLVAYLQQGKLPTNIDQVSFETGFPLAKVRIDPADNTLTMIPKNRENELLLMRRMESEGETMRSTAAAGCALLSPSGTRILMQDGAFTSLAVLSADSDQIVSESYTVQMSDLLSRAGSCAFSADEESLYCGGYIVHLADGTVSELPSAGGFDRTAVSFVPALSGTVTAAMTFDQASGLPRLRVFLEEEDRGEIAVPEEFGLSTGRSGEIFRLDSCGLLLRSGRPDLLAYDVTDDSWRTFPVGGTVTAAVSGNTEKIVALADGQTLRLADFRSGDSLWETELSFPAELVSGLWFSPDDGLLLVPYGNTRCALFRVSDGTLLNDLAFETEAESSPVSMQLDADGRLYVYNAGPPAAQSDSLVLDAETGELLGRIPGLVFVNFRTRKLYIRDSQNRYTSLFPLFSLEELVSMAEDPD